MLEECRTWTSVHFQVLQDAVKANKLTEEEVARVAKDIPLIVFTVLGWGHTSVVSENGSWTSFMWGQFGGSESFGACPLEF